jgi:flagellin
MKPDVSKKGDDEMSVGAINNPTAFSVYTNYAASSTNLSKSMTRLATGVKSVADDGAGVGISERMRSQSRSTAMARNNVENGISALQTADSWMQRLNDMLSRMHELSIEAGDATKTSTDVTNIKAEFDQLKSEIGRITDGNGTAANAAAKFNSKNLLDGTFNAGVATQVGADSGQTITVSIAGLSTLGDGGSIAAVNGGALNASHAGSMAKAIAGAIDRVAKSRANVGGILSRLENTRSGLLTYEDNIRTAESKIRDVDMARESSEMTKQQILSQVGNAMLAQANQMPGSVLQLVG